MSKRFTATFDKYNINLIQFTDVTDERGNMIKPNFSIPVCEYAQLVGTLIPGCLITFLARIAIDKMAPQGFTLNELQDFCIMESDISRNKYNYSNQVIGNSH